MQDASSKKGFSIPEENRDIPRLLNTETIQTNTTTTRKSLATKLTSALNHKSIGDIPKKAITKLNARKLFWNVSYAESSTNCLVETIGNSTYLSISRIFRLIQLNIRKQDVVFDSLMNNEQIQDTTILAIQEPWARRTKDLLLIMLIYYYK